ncbi:MAG: NHLP bacteriocin export ABC transporter permease/ATPase subunit [Erysipelotrichaceae bacterium]|nr:NHLP bacteriocin export ABC transporter permease/ATPase subunit [Erysipelotrichaceae bacterium]
MGWVENQIADRRAADEQLLEDSFAQIAGVILDRQSAERISDRRIATEHVIDEILKYYHEKNVKPDERIKDPDDQLDQCLKKSGLMRREILLEDGWYRDSYGPVLAYTKQDGIPAALLPNLFGGYTWTDEHGTKRKVSKNWKEIFSEEAYCFYRPLPMRAIGIPDLLIYLKRCISLQDILLMVFTALICTMAGLLIPEITRILTGPVLASGKVNVLAGAAVFLICAAVSTQLLGIAQRLASNRIEIKTSNGVQAAMMMRILSLPASFFRQYSPGEMKSRAMSVSSLCSLLMGMVMSTTLSSLTSLLYVAQIFRFAAALVIPSVLIVLVNVCISAVSTYVQAGLDKKRMELSSKESGMSYAMITGIQKIRMAGAEKRMFARWLNLFSQGAQLSYNPPAFIKLNPVIFMAISLCSNIILYFLAVQNHLSPSTYFAFMAAYGALSGAFSALSSIALSAAQIRPILEMAEPFLKAEPEVSPEREYVSDISGRIDLEHVSFRYDHDSKMILNDISLHVKPGDYIAIVGRTGCGKSTLVRLLLGFEKPESGAVFYDGRDLSALDLSSLRRRIGTVMQNGELFSGDIFSNIAIASSHLSLEEAWQAAETAGIADDIRKMPMGMSTYVSEGTGGFSGGQKQRLMIARAIASKPKLLIFDEATSALDNITQKKVTDALDAMGCTRIVIGHRLSTIRHCSRILVMDQGKIIEDGTYEELISKNGAFAELVERQRLDRND